MYQLRSNHLLPPPRQLCRALVDPLHVGSVGICIFWLMLPDAADAAADFMTPDFFNGVAEAATNTIGNAHTLVATLNTPPTESTMALLDSVSEIGRRTAEGAKELALVADAAGKCTGVGSGTSMFKSCRVLPFVRGDGAELRLAGSCGWLYCLALLVPTLAVATQPLGRSSKPNDATLLLDFLMPGGFSLEPRNICVCLCVFVTDLLRLTESGLASPRGGGGGSQVPGHGTHHDSRGCGPRCARHAQKP